MNIYPNGDVVSIRPNGSSTILFDRFRRNLILRSRWVLFLCLPVNYNPYFTRGSNWTQIESYSCFNATENYYTT